MDSAMIREVLGAYQEICTKAKSILKKRIDDGIDTVFGARFVEYGGIQCVAVSYWGTSEGIKGLYSDYELIPADWFEDSEKFRKAHWPCPNADSKEIARKAFGMDNGELKQGILGLED